MENSFDKTALETVDLLEARLKRIEYAVCGHVSQSALQSQKKPAIQRLEELERALHQIASRSKTVQDLLKLHSRYPDLFQSIPIDEVPSTLDTSTLLSIVLASASSYSATASQLNSIEDTPIPPTKLSTQLISLQPRIAKISALQAAQSQDITELRERSATLVQRWYATNVLDAGETWAAMEGRVEGVEKKIRRAALAKRNDNEMA